MDGSMVLAVFLLGALASASSLQCYQCNNCPRGTLNDSYLITCEEATEDTNQKNVPSALSMLRSSNDCTCSGTPCACNDNGAIQKASATPGCVTLMGSDNGVEFIQRSCIPFPYSPTDYCQAVIDIGMSLTYCGTCNQDKCNTHGFDTTGGNNGTSNNGTSNNGTSNNGTNNDGNIASTIKSSMVILVFLPMAICLSGLTSLHVI